MKKKSKQTPVKVELVGTGVVLKDLKLINIDRGDGPSSIYFDEKRRHLMHTAFKQLAQLDKKPVSIIIQRPDDNTRMLEMTDGVSENTILPIVLYVTLNLPHRGLYIESTEGGYRISHTNALIEKLAGVSEIRISKTNN